MKIKNNIPNFITLINLSLGIMSIMHLFEGNNFMAALLIIVAGFADRFDGKMARKLDAESELGKQLDSLCDLVSFGMAPGFLIWRVGLYQLGVVGSTIVLMYVVAGAYRLAKYNVTEFDGRFYGIPITMAGGFISLISLYAIQYELHSNVIALLVIFFSYVMVSSKISIKKR